MKVEMNILYKLLLLFTLLACLICLPLNANNKSIVLGTQDSTQQQILGQMLGTYLESEGFKVNYKMDLSSITLFRTMNEGEVDIAWEDPASVWFLKFLQTKILSLDELWGKVKEMDKDEGLLWLGKSNLERQYVLVMERGKAEKLDLMTTSDLVNYLTEKSRGFHIAMEDEFFFRPDCYSNLKKTYDFSLPRSNIVTVAPGIGFGLLSSGEVDVIIALSTNPLITKLDLLKLEDDKKALNSYRVGIVAREKIVNKFTELEDLVDKLSKISPQTSEMTQLNLKVYQGETPEDVASEYLREKGLINPKDK